MGAELSSLVASVATDAVSAMEARKAQQPADPEAGSRQQKLLERVKALTVEEFAVVTPLVCSGVDPTLRQEVLSSFERVDAAAGAEMLMRQAEERRPSPGFTLSSGVDALSFTLGNFATYGGGLVKLKAAFGRERPRLRAIASGLSGFEKETVEEGIGALGLDDEDVAAIKKLLAAGDHQGVWRLTKALMPLDPRVADVTTELVEHTRKLAPSGSRDYGQALYVLSEVAQKFPVDPEVFVEALRLYPKSNESESAVVGLKRVASRCAREKDRGAFEKIVEALNPVGPVRVLVKHFETLRWA